MKLVSKGFLGIGAGVKLKCDSCGQISDDTFNENTSYSHGRFFRSLKLGDYCSNCLPKVDPDASHGWLPPLNGVNNLKKFKIEHFRWENDSNPKTNITVCFSCGTARVVTRLADERFSAKYFSLGSTVASDTTKCSKSPLPSREVCRHNYVTLLSTEKRPDAIAISQAKKQSKELMDSDVGTMFGYNDIDAHRHLYGERVVWCSKCGYSRSITRGMDLPSEGICSNFGGGYYQT
jgi:hypothetical protein